MVLTHQEKEEIFRREREAAEKLARSSERPEKTQEVFQASLASQKATSTDTNFKIEPTKKPSNSFVFPVEPKKVETKDTSQMIYLTKSKSNASSDSNSSSQGVSDQSVFTLAMPKFQNQQPNVNKDVFAALSKFRLFIL